MKCNYCEKNLEEIGINHGFPPVTLFPSKELMNLYVCINKDCKNCGIVLAIPSETKDINEKSDNYF